MLYIHRLREHWAPQIFHSSIHQWVDGAMCSQYGLIYGGISVGGECVAGGEEGVGVKFRASNLSNFAHITCL